MLGAVLHAALFDLYDTLVYVDEDGARAKVLTCARQAAVAPEDFHRAWFATSRESIRGDFDSIEDRIVAVLHALGRPPRADVIETISAAERSFLRTQVHPFADAHDTLAALRREGLKLAIVTNASASVAHVLDGCRLRGVVDEIVVSSAVGAVKPHPEIYAHALTRIAVGARDACFVGDGNDEELDGAKVVGLRTILVYRGRPRYGVRTSSSDTAADVTVQTLAEVPAHVRRFGGIAADMEG